ncbi:MAG: uroporphyrinogen-III C-methyltransferase, partial [Tepidimonas sp.]|uniref:uroporphyrinogen-III C-methyltransferase n=1 Tax=Tepidimonas sp. TaxID=2002775 RepID=UPI00259D5FBC
PQPRAAGGFVRLLAMVAAVLAAVALAGTALLWQRLAHTQEELARRTTDVQAELAATRMLADQAQAAVADMQARLGVAEVKLSEVSLQRSQLEELMLSVSRSRDDALVQDLEAALRLAIQQSQLTGSVQPVVTALQGAQQRIERAAQPRLNPVQRAIARDLERIRAASLVDVPALVTRLDELARAVDEWPLRSGPPLDEPARPAGAPEPMGEPLPPALTAGEGGGTADSVWARARTSVQHGIEAAWARLRGAARDLVRLRRIDQPEAVLLAPDQAYFLRENVRLMLLNARLGLLARQFDSARADLRAVERHLRRYFEIDAPGMRQTLETLAALQHDLRQESLPRPDETLAALSAAAEGR